MELVCAICCEGYNSNDSIVSVNCGHIFHEKCLTDWMKKSPTCPNCAKNSQPTKKVYLDFDNKDCSQCQQYAMLIDIKETQIDTLKSNTQSITDMKKEMTKNQLKYDELMTKIANTNKMLMQKENELLKCQQTIESLKRELSALQINDTENVAPNKADLLLHEKSGEVIQALAPIIQQK